VDRSGQYWIEVGEPSTASVGIVLHHGITNTASLLFEPPDHALTLGDAFVQDTMKLADQAALILGVKFEDDPLAGWTPLPDVRLSMRMGEHAALWAAASRAIRSPTPFDDEVGEKSGAVTELAGNSEFRPEEVMGYEWGARAPAACARATDSDRG
jgi:iron complex outermembrane receptor protein